MESLSELEEYLNQGPADDCFELQEIPVRLSKLIAEDDKETVEKTVRLLGTAVGRQSRFSLRFS
jgi:hypothetical protein